MSRKTLPTFAVALALTGSAFAVPPMVSTSPVLPSASAQEQFRNRGTVTVVQDRQAYLWYPFQPNYLLQDPLPVVTVDSNHDWIVPEGHERIRITPGPDEKVGEHRVEITATYSDGSTQHAWFSVNVEPSVATMLQPAYAAPIRVTQGHPIGVEGPNLSRNMGFYTPKSELPGWLNLRTDGSLILSPTADVAPGPYKVSTQVRYQDNSIDTFEFEVEVVEAVAGVEPIHGVSTDLPVAQFYESETRHDPVTHRIFGNAAGVGILLGGMIWDVPPTLPEPPEEPSVTPPEQPETPGEDTPEQPETPGEDTPEQPETPGEDTPEQPETPVAPPVDTGSFDEPVDATCVAVASAVGIPMLLLVPFALATDLEIPGMAPLARDVGARIASANSEIQKTMGIHDPHLSRAASEFNARVTSALNSREARGAATVATAALIFAAAVGGACAPVGGASISSAS